MADRYWVGGTETWDATAGSKWAASSGGTGGETVPGTADNVFFDGNSSGTIATSGTTTCNCLDLNFTGFTGTFSATGSTSVNVYGSLTFSSGMTLGSNSGFTWEFESTSTGRTITTAGKTPRNLSFLGVGGGWTLQDALTTGSTGNLSVSNGTLNTNGQTVTVATFTFSGTGTRAVNITNSTINLIHASAVTVWDAATTTNLTFTSTGSTISLNNVGANNQTFAGGGLTYNNLTILADAASGSVTITGSNTFNAWTIGAGGPKSIVLTDGTTQTFSSAQSTLGNGTNVVTFTKSGAGAAVAIAPSGAGQLSWDYLNLTNIPATVTAYAGANSTDGTGNTNWIFTAPPSTTNPVGYIGGGFF